VSQVPDDARTDVQTTLEWVLRQRVERFEGSGITVAHEGDAQGRATVLVPAGIDINLVKAAITSTPLLEIRLVEAGPVPAGFRDQLAQHATAVAGTAEIFRRWELTAYTGHLSFDAHGSPVRTVTPGPTRVESYYLVRRTPVLTVRDIETAKAVTGPDGGPAITMTLNDTGAARLEQVSGQNVGRSLAVIVNGNIVMAPRIDARLSRDISIKQSGCTAEEAERLVEAIRWHAVIESLTIAPRK
jgi:preprotein translocase subunit SecD